ncbi:9674_t:CDS:2, partial [Dentiscutata heterogama]
ESEGVENGNESGKIRCQEKSGLVKRVGHRKKDIRKKGILEKGNIEEKEMLKKRDIGEMGMPEK